MNTKQEAPVSAGDAIKEFQRCINALALELPGAVWDDVNKRWSELKYQVSHPVPVQVEGLRPKIICLCGSTRFMGAFQSANLNLTLQGVIVLSVGCNTKSDSDLFGEKLDSELGVIKKNLDELHKRKIDLADEILVLDVGGYIGNSTRSEIDYAIAHNKPVKYLSKEYPEYRASGQEKDAVGETVSMEEYNHAIDEIGQLQEQLKEANEYIRDLQKGDEH